MLEATKNPTCLALLEVPLSAQGPCANPPSRKHHSPARNGTQPTLPQGTASQKGASRLQLPRADMLQQSSCA
eukprot:12892522-Prorocentrum_lima.AAC.1